MRKNYFFTLVLSMILGVCGTSAQITATVNPENESQLTEISSFQITYSQEMMEDWPEGVVVLRNGYEVSRLTVSISEDKKTVTYTLINPQTEDGTYTFENLDWAVCDPTFEYETPRLDLTYYIGEPQELEPILNTSPAPDRQINSLSDVLISFRNVKTVEVNNGKSVYMTNGTDRYDYYLMAMPEYKQVYALPLEYGLTITKGGEYTLVIEEGALILDGKEYGYDLKFNITEQFAIVSSTPASGVVTVDELENITITFNKEIAGMTSYMVKNLVLNKVDSNGNIEGAVAGYIPTIDPEDSHIVHFEVDDFGIDIDESGTYSLNLPPTLFVAKDGTKNLAMIIHYEIDIPTGIKTVKTIANDSIYNLQGVKMDGKTLAPGLYIKNGKVILKK